MKKIGALKIKILGLYLLFSLSTFVAAQETPKSENKYTGNFTEKLIPDTRELYYQLFQPFDKSKDKIAPPSEKSANVSTGFIFDPRNPEKRYQIFIIEPIKENPYTCSDKNADGKIDKKECQPMNAVSENSAAFEQTLELPFNKNDFKFYPVFLRLRRDLISPELKKGGRIVQQSSMALAVGNVKIGERNLYVGYQFNISETPVDPTKGLLVVDKNGDGKFDNFPFSDESAYASDDEVVFRIGDSYISTEKLDLAAKTFVIRTRQKSDYKRQEVNLNEPLENFSFIDFAGKNRSLADFRGKYLLLDFWGVWCVDCRREIPFQIEAYKQFRSRGFEILGMNTDDEIEKAKIYLEQNKITWTQTQFESIRELVEKNFGIQQYPSTLLLAPDGKVLVLDQEKLQGNQLLKTLDQILPR